MGSRSFVFQTVYIKNWIVVLDRLQLTEPLLEFPPGTTANYHENKAFS